MARLRGWQPIIMLSMMPHDVLALRLYRVGSVKHAPVRSRLLLVSYVACCLPYHHSSNMMGNAGMAAPLTVCISSLSLPPGHRWRAVR